MSRICVATSQPRAYYSLVSKLRKAGLAFVSEIPGAWSQECDVVLTTRDEMKHFGPRALPLEELDDDPFVLKGQVLSRLDGGMETMLIGVDPGTRIGMAAYYGDMKLEFATFDSGSTIGERAAAFVEKVPAKKSLIRVGNGNPRLALELASHLAEMAPAATIEVVDESGTSSRSSKMKGVQGDQRAAARIAFRKGVVFNQKSKTAS